MGVTRRSVLLYMYSHAAGLDFVLINLYGTYITLYIVNIDTFRVISWAPIQYKDDILHV